MGDDTTQRAPVEAAVDLVGRAEQLRGQAVHAGVEVGVVDALADRPLDLDELTDELDLPRDHAARLLRALDVYGVVESTDGDGYALTAVGERFLADHPESVRDYLQFYYHPTRLAAVRHLPDIVRAGGPTGYELEYGQRLFELFDEDPAFSEQFNGMQDLSRLGETEAIVETLEAVDVGRFDSVCDVGGGYGDLLSRLLERHPHLEGTVLELPSVLADEDRLWAPRRGVGDRCEYVAGDMFESVPAADAYLLKAILHDWSDDECVDILSTIHEAAPADGRLFVRERLVSADDPVAATVTMDVWMMLETGGRERTLEAFERLFERAGWELEDVLAVEEEVSIMQCAKATGGP